MPASRLAASKRSGAAGGELPRVAPLVALPLAGGAAANEGPAT